VHRNLKKKIEKKEITQGVWSARVHENWERASRHRSKWLWARTVFSERICRLLAYPFQNPEEGPVADKSILSGAGRKKSTTPR
jgi:hypothetical protein